MKKSNSHSGGAGISRKMRTDKLSNQAKRPQQTKRSKWILWGSLIVLVAAIGIVACLSFPLRISSDLPGQLQVGLDGSLGIGSVQVSANQPLSRVMYAVNPTDAADLSQYTETDSKGSILKQDASLTDVSVPVGTSTLYLYTETIFGQSETFSAEVDFDIGNTANPQPQAIAELQNGQDAVTNELLLTVNDDVDEADLSEMVAPLDGEIVGKLLITNQYQVRFSGSGSTYIKDLKKTLETKTGISAVEYNLVLKADVAAIPDDSAFDSWELDAPAGNNWGLECIDAPGAWDYNDQLTPVKVGVIDSSLCYDHEDLQINEKNVNLMPTNDFPTMRSLEQYYKDNIPTHVCLDENCLFCGMKDHGTHCSGIIGATANNGKGVCGVNWKADMNFCSLWFFEKAGVGQINVYDTTAGMYYAISRMVMSGCRVLSMSFGGGISLADPAYEQPFIDGFNNLVLGLENNHYDFLIFKAAGNEAVDANYDIFNRMMVGGADAREHVLIVAAASMGDGTSGYQYDLAYYSNYGNMINITAPGHKIFNTYYGDAYNNMSGTSMATPMAAGVASLVYSANPSLNYSQVRSILCASPDEYAYLYMVPYGIVNAKNAVEAALNFNGTITPPQTPAYGFLNGVVMDSVTNDLLYDVAVKITNEATGAVYNTSTPEGTYHCMVPPGKYTITYSLYGYQSEIAYHVEVAQGVCTYNPTMVMSRYVGSRGYASGKIIDTFDGKPIAGAVLKFYRGVGNNGDTTLVRQLTSSASGTYSAFLEPGNYSVVMTCDGYQSDISSVLVISNVNTGNQDCAMTPVLEEGEIRFVLTWEAYPEDLDSHLTGPSPDGKFHVYYTEQEFMHQNLLYENLDKDIKTGYGPETTSVFVGQEGTYNFYVHDFTNRAKTDTCALGKSHAQVKVYVAGAERPTIYQVPNVSGTLWTVCSITDGVITPVNTMGYQSSQDKIGQ